MSDTRTKAPTLRFHTTFSERVLRLLNRLALDRKLGQGGRLNASALLSELVEAEAVKAGLREDA